MRIIITLLLASCTSIAQGARQDVVRPVTLDKKTPLTTAVAALGTHLERGAVSFGVDLWLEREEPAVTLRLKQGQTLTDGLGQLVSQVPGYVFRTPSAHLVEIYRSGTEGDPSNLLNQRISRFEVVNQSPADILANPARFMPELKHRLQADDAHPPCGAIGPGLRSVGPGITLHLENTTVRQILNAVAEASFQLALKSKSRSVTPLGWIHISRPATSGNGRSDEWRFYSTVPKAWLPEDVPLR